MCNINNFEKNLSKLRKLKNLSQKDLTVALGLSSSTISMYETNQHQPKIDGIEEIALYLPYQRMHYQKKKFWAFEKFGRQYNNIKIMISFIDLVIQNNKSKVDNFD